MYFKKGLTYFKLCPTFFDGPETPMPRAFGPTHTKGHEKSSPGQLFLSASDC